MSTFTHFKTARIIFLQLTAALGTVAACIGLNALVKSNQMKSAFKGKAPASTTVTIDTSPISNSGIVATVGCAVLSLFAFIFFSMTLLPKTRALANKTLKLQAGVLGFFTAWIFACMIPFMKYYYNDRADVRAFIGTTELPESLIRQMEARSGSSSVYRGMWFLRLLAIFPWLAIASALITIPILLKAANTVKSAPPVVDATAESSKESVQHSEKV